MFTRTDDAASAVRQAVDPACARQVFAELRWNSGHGGDGDEPLRVRLDRMVDDELHVNLIPSIDRSRAPKEGQRATIRFFMDGYRYEFEAPVRNVVCRTGPRDVPVAAALILGLPGQVVRQPRRSSFRVSVAGHGDLRVVMCPAVPERADCCPIDACPVRGRIVNVSAGGLCAVVQVGPGSGIHPGQRLFAEFNLPEIDQPFRVLTEVRHVRSMHHGGGALLGLRFENGVDGPIDLADRSISQFVAREEGRRLRRKR